MARRPSAMSRLASSLAAVTIMDASNSRIRRNYSLCELVTFGDGAFDELLGLGEEVADLDVVPALLSRLRNGLLKAFENVPQTIDRPSRMSHRLVDSLEGLIVETLRNRPPRPICPALLAGRESRDRHTVSLGIRLRRDSLGASLQLQIYHAGWRACPGSSGKGAGSTPALGTGSGTFPARFVHQKLPFS